MRGRITATAGKIGDFNISEGGAFTSGALFTDVLNNRRSVMTADQITQLLVAGNENFTARFENGIAKIQWFSSFPFFTYTNEIRYNGMFGPGVNPGDAANLFVTSGNHLMLSTNRTDRFVYASNGSSTINNAFRVAVSTSGPSTKIIKKDINTIDSNLVEEFFDKLEINTYTDLMKNKSKIGLIIEDAEEQNMPFQNMVFKREDQMVLYETLPD
jgi:hypothetical protein